MLAPLQHGGAACAPRTGEGALASNVTLALLVAALRAWRSRLLAFDEAARDAATRADALRRRPVWLDVAAVLFAPASGPTDPLDDWPPGDARRDAATHYVDLVYRTVALDHTRETLIREWATLERRVYGFIVRATLPTSPTGVAELTELLGVFQAFVEDRARDGAKLSAYRAAATDGLYARV